MKHTFRTFQLLQEGSGYGVPHLEDLDVETFIQAINKLHTLQAVQKLDGANLLMGVDRDGELYTSREQKGGKRFYSQRDFPKTSNYDAFRAAHEFLMQNAEKVLGVMEPGEAINMEVIYGPQPNTVFYGKDGLCYLAFLEAIPGDDPSVDPNQKRVTELTKAFGDQVTVVKTVATDTTDGTLINQTPLITEWKVTTSDAVPQEELGKIGFDDELHDLKKFLNSQNEVAEGLGKDLNNFEVLKDKSKELKDERERLNQVIMDDYKLPIKRQLLKLSNKQRPSIRGHIDDAGAYHGIEGLIFTDPKTRERFKVVDRDTFSKVNQFNYQVRNAIDGRTYTTDPNAPIEERGGIVGDARLRAVRLLGIENSDQPTQAKRVLDKFKGSSREETLQNIADSLHQLSYEAARRKMMSIYASAYDDLDDALNEFKMHVDDYKLELPDGEVVHYTKEIRRRTLLAFAGAQREVLGTLQLIKKATDISDLIEVFFSKQLDEIGKQGPTAQ